MVCWALVLIYSRAQRWNGRVHVGVFMLVPEESFKNDKSVSKLNL
jgi:hypothetical protein